MQEIADCDSTEHCGRRGLPDPVLTLLIPARCALPNKTLTPSSKDMGVAGSVDVSFMAYQNLRLLPMRPI
jgi:hypothetical protein